MRGVDHYGGRGVAFAGQGGEEAVEDARLAPAHKAIIERLGRAVAGGRVAPPQAVSDNMDDPGDDPPVIDPGHAAHLGR